MNYSIFDIYYEVLVTFNVKNQQSKKIILNDIKGVLNDGVNDYEIIKHIKNNSKASSWSKVNIRSLCNGKKDKYSINYINGNEMYYHNELRLTTKPPKKTFDIITGEFITKSEKFFLEMKSSYSVNNLFEYLKQKPQFLYCTQDEVRTKGGLIHLLKKYKVDFLLFLIDTANEYFLSEMKFANNILEIDKFYKVTMENYNRKITECVTNNLDKVVLKERRIY